MFKLIVVKDISYEIQTWNMLSKWAKPAMVSSKIALFVTLKSWTKTAKPNYFIRPNATSLKC